eukprot:CAMPEP_0178410660 /NCGR_PEP_ID=MMETSP0689_2-20121128/21097_1 /TAXON_ID=160604 /ORGANISM="Amphidinium massartii, Strain CS-259" /LENGTH=88 /DNA_ID=CAMNT_0020031849 /DNA_START=336 /DNA_END=602 /DNA_ORIENTATION=-
MGWTMMHCGCAVVHCCMGGMLAGSSGSIACGGFSLIALKRILRLRRGVVHSSENSALFLESMDAGYELRLGDGDGVLDADTSAVVSLS